jgi:hypothetical protein
LWSTKPVFHDGKECVGNLSGSFRGTMKDPRISEEGRRFLADRLALLSDQQIHDLFAVARIDGRGETLVEAGHRRPVTVDDWVRAFKDRRAQISERRCAP